MYCEENCEVYHYILLASISQAFNIYLVMEKERLLQYTFFFVKHSLYTEFALHPTRVWRMRRFCLITNKMLHLPLFMSLPFFLLPFPSLPLVLYSSYFFFFVTFITLLAFNIYKSFSRFQHCHALMTSLPCDAILFSGRFFRIITLYRNWHEGKYEGINYALKEVQMRTNGPLFNP